MENKSQYCELKDTLMEYLPLKVIDAVQTQVNKNVSSYIIMSVNVN